MAMPMAQPSSESEKTMTSNQQLKVGLVGCGKIADAHVEEIQKIENAELVAVCDVERLMAEQLAVRFQVPRHYDDFATLLAEEKPDVIHITTPPQSHLALATQAFDAGCHVYVEKPAAPNAPDTRRMLECAEKAERKMTVGYSFHFDQAALALRQLVKKGQIGDPVHLESHFGYALDGPFGATILGSPHHWVHQLPGKLFHNNLDHALIKILEFLPDNEPAVHAFGYRGRSGVHGDIRDEMMDELRVVLLGEKTSAYMTFTSHAKPVGHFLRIYGTENTATVNYGTRVVTLDRAQTLPSAIGRLLPPFKQHWDYLKAGSKNVWRFATSDFHFFSGINELTRLFYDSIIHDSPLPVSYRDILRVSEITDEVYRQLNQATGTKTT
jgi:predicted dehydrogenase